MEMQSYTLSLWYRVQVPLQKQQMTIISVSKLGFECQLKQNLQIQCVSNQTGPNMQINANPVSQQWQIMTLKADNQGDQRKSELKVLDLTGSIVAQQIDSNRFFPTLGSGATNTSFQQLSLGISYDLQSNGFIGNLRNLKLLEGFFSDQVIYKMQFIYLTPLQYVKVQLLSDVKELQNQGGSMINSIIIGKLSLDYDSMGAFQCTNRQMYNQSFLQRENQVMQGQIRFNTISVSSEIFDVPYTRFDRESNLQTWIYHEVDFGETFANDDFILRHDGVLSVYFKKQMPNMLLVENPFATAQQVRTYFPPNEWIFLSIVNQRTKITVVLRNSTGQTISTTITNFNQPSGSVKRDITIFERFNGKVLGLKYYKGSIPMVSDFHYFWEFPLPSVSETAVIAFYFDSTGLAAGSKDAFRNYGRNGGTLTMADPNAMRILFGKSYFITNKIYPLLLPFIPSFKQEESYDGYSCVDNKEKLFFPSSKGNAYSTVNTGSTINQYTIELWFKASRGLVGENYMLSITNSLVVAQNKPQIAILQENDGILACVPSFTSSTDIKVRYFDYQKESRAWTHVSCSYDGQKLIAAGFMLQQNVEYQSYTEFTKTQNQSIPQSNIFILVNSNGKTLLRGSPSTFYSEVRLWKSVRTLKEVQSMRYQQLDIANQPQYLLSYMKLMSGLKTNELDYASGAQIQLSFTEWQPDYELLICPVGTYRPSQFDMNCYRDGIQEIQLLYFKTANGINITSYFSNFQNINMRDSVTNFFNFTWSIDAVYGPSTLNSNRFRSAISNQSSQQDVFLDYQQIADSPQVKYALRLTLNDKLQLQDSKSGTINIIPMRCGNIFDMETKESFLYRDLEIQKGVEDYTLYYDFTDCPDYKIDQNLMVFSIDGVGDLSSGEHNIAKKSFTLKSLFQSALPINDYFYLKVRAYWKNIKNQFDQFSFNLIYGFRIIQKLVVQLEPSSTLLLKGQTLQISAQPKLINANQFPSDRSFQGRWICPGKLQQFCSIVTSQTLRIPFETIINYNYPFWDPQNYTYVGTTNYLQIDGSKQSNRTVRITWLDALQNINVRSINQANIQIPFSWQVEESYSRPELFQLQWDINPPVASQCLLNFANRTQYSINQTCLREAMTYELSIRLQYLVTKTVISTQRILFTVPRKPFGGKLQCNPTAGKAFSTRFNCSTTGWTVVDNVVQYQFFTKDPESGSQMIAGPIQSSPLLINTVLPPTKIITVKVIDKFNQIGESIFAVNITYQPDASSTSTLEQLLNEYKQNKTNQPTTPPTPVTPTSTPPVKPTPTPTPLTPTPNPKPPTPTPTPSPVTPTPPKPPVPPPPIIIAKDPMDLMSKLVVAVQSLPLDAKTQSKQQLQDTAFSLTRLISNQSVFLNQTVQDVKNKSFFISGTLQVMQVITNNSSKALNTSSLSLIQGSISNFLTQTDSLITLQSDSDFQRNFFNVQSNSLNSVKTMEGENNDQQVNEIAKSIRKNLQTYETQLSRSGNLVQGKTIEQTTDSIDIKVNQFSKSGNQTIMNDQFVNSKDIQAVFPLSTALQPSQKQTLTIINFKQSPYLNSETQINNQTLLTNNTLFFAFRDKDGSYLNSSYLLERIKMNFTIPQLSSYNKTQLSTIKCAYSSPEDKYFQTLECETKFNLTLNMVLCSCKHMSYYTIIDNKFDEVAYRKSLQSGLFTIRIKNWIFFIPALYLLFLFIWGIIYTQNKDQVDFRFIADQEELQLSPEENKKENSITLTALLFHRKIAFQNRSQSVTFCAVFKYLILMTHPLFQLKYRFDPTLPRFYKFLMIYTRIMVIFGLCFYFLRSFINFELILKKPRPELTYDLIYLGVSLAICSCALIPLPVFLYGCCRSRYFLGQPDKLTESGSRDELRIVAASQEPANNQSAVTKVEIDPSLPMKLLFLANASSHDKLIAESSSIESFASGNIRAVGTKLRNLQIESGFQQHNMSLNKMAPDDIVSVPHQEDTQGKQYIVDNLTEMDMIKNLENSQRNVIASESKIGKRDSSPPPNHAGRSPSISGSIGEPNNNKRLITFQRGDFNTGNFSSQQRKSQNGGHQARPLSQNDIKLKFDHNRQSSINQQQYRSLRSGQGANSQIFEKVNSFNQQKSHRSSNRISQTEENEEDITPRQQYEGGEDDRRKNNTSPKDHQNGPRSSSNLGGGSMVSANIINFDDDLIRGESEISIDSKLVAAEDKKDLYERRGFAILGRIIAILLALGINGFVIFVVGYYYYKEAFYNSENNYVWVVIFFAAQFIGFFIIDMIVLLLMTIFVKSCCQNSKTFLAALMRESLYVYEDYKYVTEFTFKQTEAPVIDN